MIVVYCFYPQDEDLAVKNAQWMNELGGCPGHEVFMIHDRRCQRPDAVKRELEKSFDQVTVLRAGADIDGWPQGANYFFRLASGYLQGKGNAFFWLEPDAIPLVTGWLDRIEQEYKRVGKPFMGDRVQVEDIPVHMSGVGIYPNPLHAYAGEAYRAHDLAWDMAGKDQILPKAHFTKLIEHAWKHPSFTNVSELRTQIRPQAVIFHASKDGSLIDILRDSSTQSGRQIADRFAVQVGGPAPNGPSGREVGATSPRGEVYAGSSPVRANAAPELNIHSVRAEPTTRETPSREEIGTPAAQPSCDIFIRTYPKDYPWLYYCLQSIKKYAVGFRKVWVVSPEANALGPWMSEIEWKQMNDETEDGYLAQQITKLYADVITSYQADYILHIDSDTLLTRRITPGDFLLDDKVLWIFTPYTEIQTPWQPITEKLLGEIVPNEYMRRLPIMVPRWLYPRLREFCFRRHEMTISDYVRTQPHHAFSEFNALGAYANKYFNNRFEWRNTLTTQIPPPCARQFQSWNGITDQVKAEMDMILRGTESNPEDAPQPDMPELLPTSVPSQIKVLPSGLWVLHGDQISRWVEQEGRLDHDQNLLPHILKLIKESDTVLDVGAFIGDHTVAYAAKANRVIAYEPNPVALECLLHNTMKLENVEVIQGGLSDKDELVPLSGNNGNYGGCYVGDHMPIATVAMHRLDDLHPAPIHFIKFDCEGYEVKALMGAEKTIEKYHPTMVIEINREALRRQNACPEDIYGFLKNRGYAFSVMQENCCFESPLFDIACTHRETSPEVSDQGNGERGLTRCSSPPPPVIPPATIKETVTHLQGIAARSDRDRWQVMYALYKAGLTPRKDNKKKKRKKVSREIPVPSLEMATVETKATTAKAKRKPPE